MQSFFKPVPVLLLLAAAAIVVAGAHATPARAQVDKGTTPLFQPQLLQPYQPTNVLYITPPSPSSPHLLHVTSYDEQLGMIVEQVFWDLAVYLKHYGLVR